MPTFTSNSKRHPGAIDGLLASMVALAAAAIAGPAFAQAPVKDKIPELASASFAWLGGGEWRDPPAGLRGPVRNDPAHPYHGNNAGPGRITVRISNWKDPVLK